MDALQIPADLSRKNAPGFVAGVRLYVLATPAGTETRRAAVEAATGRLRYAAFLFRSKKTLANYLTTEGEKIALMQETI